ncbi:MAG: hypothetical protein A2X23_05895 [Chloroflexi bacterium GWC2_73_18]|nr:MAG: hypothetical protein A2X23_05895 [Chloroflexi bacterium GWC2_73_18]
MNRYLYAEANPATLIDPTGHCPALVLAAAGPLGAIAGGGACLVGWAVVVLVAVESVVVTQTVVVPQVERLTERSYEQVPALRGSPVTVALRSHGLRAAAASRHSRHDHGLVSLCRRRR